MTVLQTWMLVQTGLLRAQTAAQLSPIKNPTKCKISPIDPEIRRWIMARKVLQYDVTVNLTLDLQDRKCHHRCHNCRHNCVKFWHNCESSKNVGGDYLSHVQSDSHDSLCHQWTDTHTLCTCVCVQSLSSIWALFPRPLREQLCRVNQVRLNFRAVITTAEDSHCLPAWCESTSPTFHVAYQPDSTCLSTEEQAWGFLMVKPNIDQISSYFERLVNWRWKPAALDHCT